MGDEVEDVKSLTGWVDDLTEKGRSKREAGLDYVIGYLRAKVPSGDEDEESELSKVVETLVHNLKGMLKKAKGEELAKVCAAIQALGASISREDAKSTFEEFLAPLSLMCREASTDDEIQHGMMTLAALCFLCNEENEHLLKVLGLAEALIRGYVADEPKVAALRSWGLLATLLDESYVSANLTEMVSMLTPLLSHECLDVKVEAGENLAFLVAFKRDQDEAEDEEQTGAQETIAEQGIVVENQDGFILPKPAPSANETTSTENNHQGGNNEDNEDDELWLDELVESLENLSHEGGRSTSKRDLKEQRARFRTIVACVRDGEFPEEKLMVDKTNVTFDNWAEIKRVGFLKDVLHDGFIGHFKANGLLHEIFDLHSKGLDEHLFGNRLVALDGKTYFSGRSKLNKNSTIERNKARKKRDAVKNDFITN